MADQQRINGFAPSWSDIYVKIDDDRYYGILEISYGDKRARSKLYGMGKHHAPRGRTAGKYEPDEGSMKMDLPAAHALREALAAKASDGKSFGSVEFQIVVQYADGENTRTHTLHRCTLAGVTSAHAEGPDALVEDLPFDVLHIDRDGLTLYDATEDTP